jgi:glutathione S-transferase
MLALYHNNISVCAQKVRIALAEKALDWTGHHINLAQGEQGSPGYLKINPRGLVPALAHDGQVIVESTVINEYLEDAFPDRPLRPAMPLERARMRYWTKLCDEGLHTACGSISFAAAFARQLVQGKTAAQVEERLAAIPDPARRERQRQIIRHGFEVPFVQDHLRLYDAAIGQMEAALQSTPWLAGSQFSLADVSLIPYVERMYRLGLEGLWQARPRVTDWFERVRQRASFGAIRDFDPMDYDDRIRGKEDHWPKVAAILGSARPQA